MNTTLGNRPPDGERHQPAVGGQAVIHGRPPQAGPGSQPCVPDDRGKHVVGHPVENPGLGATRVGAAADAGKAEDRLHHVLAALTHATRVATLEKLAASIAHEINQPLAAIVMNGGACMKWLDREVPDLEEVRSAARRIIADASRAAEIVRLLGALSRKTTPEYRLLNINDLVTETIPL